MQKYHRVVSPLKTPQSEPIPGSNQVVDSAGGYVWAVDCWQRLRRFLILGADSGTYYIGRNQLVKENADSVQECLKEDGLRTVREIVEASQAGRAPNNDPALFALAMACADEKVETRRAAFAALPKVARIGTHLFHFAEYLQAHRGWGKLARKGIGEWYLSKPLESLAYQAVKYRQRDGWTHRDLLRLAHPPTDNSVRKAIFNWVCGRETPVADLPDFIRAFIDAQSAENVASVCSQIREHRLPWEAVPDKFKDSAEVWSALLEHMPVGAMVRNLGKMSAVGLLKPLSGDLGRVTDALGDAEKIAASRIHPIQVLLALRTYRSGKGFRGSLTWNAAPQIIEALDAAFYLAFENVEPTGKRFLLGVDVSGSMSHQMASGLTCTEAAAAMAMTAVRSEKLVYPMAFSHEFRPLPISKASSLEEAARAASDSNFGGTDCSLPMLHAAEHELEVDCFVVYTDNETWAGSIHPAQALQAYRKASGIAAKLCVTAFASNGFTIADPKDPGMLDVVGFDASAPVLLGEFAR